MKSNPEICPTCGEPRACEAWSTCHCGQVFGAAPTGDAIPKPVVAAPARAPSPACPQCGVPMVDGVVCLEQGVMLTIATGPSRASLWWRRRDREPLELLVPWQYRDAFHCDGCGTIVLPPSKKEG